MSMLRAGVFGLVVACGSETRSPAEPVGQPTTKPREPRTAADTPLEHVVAVQAEDSRACALTAAGELYCWGRWETAGSPVHPPGSAPANERDDKTNWMARAAMRIAAPSRISHFRIEHGSPSAGGRAWALDSGGRLLVWGADAWDLDIGPPWQRSSRSALELPVRLEGSFAAGGCATCYASPNGLIDLQLLEGRSRGALRVGLVRHESRHERELLEIAGVPGEWCALDIAGSVVCTTPTQTELGTEAPVAAGFERLADGSLVPVPWERGATVPQRSVETPSLEQVPLPGRASQLVRGLDGWVARLKDGRLFGWHAFDVELGSTGLARHAPGTGFGVRRVDAVDKAELVVASRVDTCALKSGGEAICWVPRAYHPAVVGVAREPSVYSGLGEAKALARGVGFICALQETGAVKCAGANEQGQCGVGSTAESIAIPTEVVASPKD